MEKPDQVCDLGRLQHLSAGKVQQEVGDDGGDGQGQEQQARVPGARLRTHGESSLEGRKKQPTPGSCLLQALQSQERVHRPQSPKSKMASPALPLVSGVTWGASHLTALSLSFLCKAERTLTLQMVVRGLKEVKST